MNQKGNALFLILIAVALFAALSYAVTQSGRSGGGIDKEQTIIKVAQLTQYISSIRTAVTRMRLSGTPIASLDFTEAGVGEDAVFAPEGGGVAWQSLPDGFATLSDWGYLTTFTVTGIGGADPDIMMRASLVTDLDACQEFNNRLGLTGAIAQDTNPLDTVIDAYPGEPAACYLLSAPFTGAYRLYFVLIEQ